MRFSQSRGRCPLAGYAGPKRSKGRMRGGSSPNIRSKRGQCRYIRAPGNEETARRVALCVPQGVAACRAGRTCMHHTVRRALAAARNSNTDIAVGQPRHPALTSPHAGQTRDLAAAARPHPASSSLSGAVAGAGAATAPGGDHARSDRRGGRARPPRIEAQVRCSARALVRHRHRERCIK